MRNQQMQAFYSWMKENGWKHPERKEINGIYEFNVNLMYLSNHGYYIKQFDLSFLLLDLDIFLLFD